jgi:hypothetical protein
MMSFSLQSLITSMEMWLPRLSPIKSFLLAAGMREEEFLKAILPNAHVKPAAGGTGVPSLVRTSSAPGFVDVVTFVHYVGREELSSCRATKHDADGCLAVV